MDISPPDFQGKNNSFKKGLEDKADFTLANNLADKDVLYNDDYNDDNKNKKSISPKVVFSALVIVALGTLFYGFISLSAKIYSGANLQAQKNQNTPAEADNFIDEVAKLKLLDTDKDGLNDYDEINVYGTSAYLADTDGDGYNDKKEIDTDHDPLCPKVDSCRGDWTGKKSNATSTNDIVPKIIAPENNLTASSSELTAEQMQLLGQLTPSEVRELLKSLGQISEEQLSQIDDATLMQIYSEVLGQTVE